MDRLISADALMREVETCIYNNKQLIDEWFANVITDAIDEQPTVDAEPVRHGHWIESHEVFDYIKCSECGEDWCTEDNDTETFNYCPNCGAKMDEVRDE